MTLRSLPSRRLPVDGATTDTILTTDINCIHVKSPNQKPTIMKTTINTIVTRLSIAILASAFVSCATVDHPLTRHDMDGSGTISHSEYQQNHMQYNLASRQRADEYSRARLATAHLGNANDFISQARYATYQLKNFSY